MVLEIYGVRASTLDRLIADPPLVWQLIAAEDPDAYEAARAEERKSSGGFLARLFGRGGRADDERAVAPLALEADETVLADLDKSWHGLHYLLTGVEWESSSPMDFLAAGGTEIGKVDVGYGPARYLRPAEVQVVARALAALSDEQLRARFDPEDMLAKKIYPDIWTRDPSDDDSLGYLIENLAALRAALETAASRGYGLVLVLR